MSKQILRKVIICVTDNDDLLLVKFMIWVIMLNQLEDALCKSLEKIVWIRFFYYSVDISMFDDVYSEHTNVIR